MSLLHATWLFPPEGAGGRLLLWADTWRVATPVRPSLEELTRALPSLMMATLRIWLPLWWPLIGSALLLQWAQRLLPAPRP